LTGKKIMPKNNIDRVKIGVIVRGLNIAVL
jgi:hypothetical protein